MNTESEVAATAREDLESLFRERGYTDFKWIDPKQIVVSQWVRMKCTFGCGEFARNASCPPYLPTVSECERFFREYSSAVVFHFQKQVARPEDRHAWSRTVNLDLLKVEREVFLAGHERAFLLFMDSCCICEECSGDRETCRVPRSSRPAPEAMAVDVFSTVRQLGFPIDVKTEYSQPMDRYAFLMIE